MDLIGILVDGFIIVDSDKKIINISEKAEQLTGYTFTEIIGQPCCNVFKSDLCQEGCLVDDIFKKCSAYSNLYVKMRRKEHAPVLVSIAITPLKDLKGKVIGAIINIKDLSEIKCLIKELNKKNEEILDEKNKSEAILNSISEGLFTIDNNWKITSFNRSAEIITGYNREEALGRKCHLIFRSTACKKGCPMKKTLYTGEPIFDAEVEIVNKNNNVIPLVVSTSLLMDKNEQVIGCVETFRDISEIRWMKKELGEIYEFSNIVGKSQAMQELYSQLKDVALTDTNVLIQGESGTGKELVARAIHYNSKRKNRPFIGLNCAALTESLLESELFGHEKGAFTGAVHEKIGRFEMAHGGTLFLDEIGEISPAMQVALLRVLEQKEFQRVGGIKNIRVDIRIIAATNKNLYEEVERKRFREDLYYRLNVFPIYLPPLRDRKEDIYLMIEHFIKKFSKKMGRKILGFTPDAMERIMAYDWPGNVRELENAIEYTFVHCKSSRINATDLPSHISPITNNLYRQMIKEQNAAWRFERQKILNALNEARGKRKKAAQMLGISPVTLWRKMKKYQIKPEFSTFNSFRMDDQNISNDENMIAGNEINHSSINSG